MRIISAGLCALVLLGGCGPRPPAAESPAAPAAPVSAPPAAPVSALRNAPEFAGCAWREVRGARLTMQAFACGPDHGGVHVEADDGLPGFRLVDGSGESRMVVRTFDKAADAPLAAILPAVRAASPGPYTAACAFAPAPGHDAKGQDRFVFEPTGADKAVWEKSQASDAPMEPPCGPLGVSITGDRYFAVMADHPQTVVYADMGSEIQIFDPKTLRLANAP